MYSIYIPQSYTAVVKETPLGPSTKRRRTGHIESLLIVVLPRACLTQSHQESVHDDDDVLTFRSSFL